MDEQCKKYIDDNVEKELHIINSKKRFEIFDSTKGDILSIVREYLAIYRSQISSCKTASELNIKYYASCHALNCKKVLTMASNEIAGNDILSVLSFYCNAVFNVSQSVHRPVSEDKSKRKPSLLKTAARSLFTLSNNIPETERGLLSIAGGTLSDIYKSSMGKQHFRIRMKRYRQSNVNNAHSKIICALRMTSNEKANAPPSLLCRDRGGLVVPKMCLLPYIRLVITTVMQFATSDGIKQHGRHLLKVNEL